MSSLLRTLFAATLLLSSVVYATPLKTAALLEEAKEPVRVVCIGDSITGVYYHTGGLRAYPEMLKVALHKLYPRAQVSVRNAGISGDTTKGGLARLDRDVLQYKPHLVTVMFGMNDLVRTPVEEFKKNLTTITERCRTAGAEVLLCTQNTVVETPQRPIVKLAEFTQAIIDVAKANDLGVADCQAAFAAVESRSKSEWQLLMSDTIHPNMDGHKLFAATIARAVSGRDVSLTDAGPPEPALRHTFANLESGKPVKVLAMPPYDSLIASALRRVFPNAQPEITAWPTEGQTLVQLDQAADKVRKTPVDVVIVAIPASAGLDQTDAPPRHYSWILNRSLSFGPQQWDVVAVLPSVAAPDETRITDKARRMIAAQDLTAIDRPSGDQSSASDLLGRWVEAQYAKWQAAKHR